MLAVRGSLVDAERLARQAVDVIDGTGYLDARNEMWLRLGEVLRLAGKDEEAADALRQSLAMCERKGNLIRAEQARRELDELRASLG
jgi:hypothetical protein